MPRVYADSSIKGFGHYCDNDPLDYCMSCWSRLKRGPRWPRLIEANGSSWDGDEHPPYDECGYPCETCGTLLTEKDD